MSSDEETDLSDVDSFGTIEEEIQELSHFISEMYGEAEALEARIQQIQRPLESLMLDQLGQVPFLKASPFREARFQVKSPGFQGIDLAQRYPFKEICEMMRAYLIKSGAVQADGSIRLNAQLKTLFEVEEDTIGYVALMGHLRSVLV